MMGNGLICVEKIPERPVGSAASQASQSRDLTKLRIVIVDDEFLVAWHLQTMLGDLNFTHCEIANDAQGAIDCVINQEPDLVLMDVNLGEGLDGIETVRRIQGYRKVAVIFVTAYTDDFNLGRIRQQAPDAAILSKPVSPQVLRATIERMFQTGLS